MTRADLPDLAALEFETERLRARRLCADDESLFCGLYTDPETMRFIGQPLAPERAARSFRSDVGAWERHPVERAVLGLVDKTTQIPLGICAVVQLNEAVTRAEVGMMLVDGARAQGVAKECLAELVTRTFAVFPVDEIWVQYSPEHSVAERLVISVGFSPRADGCAYKVASAKNVWSAFRSSWSSTIHSIHRGGNNVDDNALS